MEQTGVIIQRPSPAVESESRPNAKIEDGGAEVIPRFADHHRSANPNPERSEDEIEDGGAEGIRTLDPHVANVVLSQLSYRPLARL